MSCCTECPGNMSLLQSSLPVELRKDSCDFPLTASQGSNMPCSTECFGNTSLFKSSLRVELRKDSRDFPSTEGLRDNKAGHKGNMPSSAECSANSTPLKSALPEDCSSKTEGNEKQVGSQENPNSSTLINIDNSSVSKPECEKEGERLCAKSIQPDDVTEGICSTSSKDRKKVENALENKTVTIVIKHNKAKHELCVQTTDNGKAILQVISDSVSIPVSKLKLVHKGKMATCDNIRDILYNKALFLAFGEISESEDGLEKADVDLIVKQLGVERNLAVRVLRRTGNVLDAIIEIGNM